MRLAAAETTRLHTWIRVVLHENCDTTGMNQLHSAAAWKYQAEVQAQPGWDLSSPMLCKGAI